MENMRHEREAALFDHYNNHPEYYSPISDGFGLNQFLSKFGLATDMFLDVLDVGCGDGRLARLWPKATVTGVDISPVRIEIARETKGTFFCMDIYDFLDEDEHQYDLGVACEVLEHLEDPRTVVDGMLALCQQVVGTVPVNMPYVAHLDVYKDIDDVHSKLSPDTVVEYEGHFYCEWLRK